MGETFITRRHGKGEYVPVGWATFDRTHSITIPDLIGKKDFVLFSQYDASTDGDIFSLIYRDGICIWLERYKDVSSNTVGGPGSESFAERLKYDEVTGTISSLEAPDDATNYEGYAYFFSGGYEYIIYD
ncbi:MAG: hypothetical protein IJY93_01200 [Clostridia bacterium]|nr:hypothetical protein [Clostridia bacterium]